MYTAKDEVILGNFEDTISSTDLIYGYCWCVNSRLLQVRFCAFNTKVIINTGCCSRHHTATVTKPGIYNASISYDPSNEMSATLCIAITYQEIGCHAQIARTIESCNSRARAKILVKLLKLTIELHKNTF